VLSSRVADDGVSRRPRALFFATVAVLAAYNVVRAFGGFAGWETGAALTLAATVVALAWRGGLTFPDLGLARADGARGLRWGGVAFGVIALVVGVVALIPATRGALDDSRGDLDGARLIVEILVGILITTVIPEELAFRGVLLGAGTRAWGRTAAIVGSSVVFGLWHIAPTLHTVTRHNALESSGVAAVGVVAATVAATTVAGAVFAWLRLRSASLVAPVLAHLGTNAIALTAAWMVRH